MLQVPFIRENFDTAVSGLLKRNITNSKSLLEEVLDLDEKRRKTQSELDNNLSQSNKLSKEIGKLFQEGKAQEANAMKAQTSKLKETSKTLSDTLDVLATSLNEALCKIPNIPHSSVQQGIDEQDNQEVFSKGTKPVLHPESIAHWELAKQYDIIDFELGNKITGAGFPVYKGKGARLQRALISYFLDKNTSAGYTEYQPPLLVNENSSFGTGQLPDKEGQMYFVNQDNLYLIPTSEVPITNIFRDVILDENQLPICCTAYTPCFRREAGSYGSHVRGLNRLHQFDKVEIVRIEKPENSYKALDEMVSHVKTLLDELQLPYRILRLCGADLGFTSALTYDFEVFSAAQERWLEVSSVSNFESFQSHRLKLRFRNIKGKTQLAHTLNGSALALPRILATLLENNQKPNEISIPKVLQPYTGFSSIQK